jgi:hypothetical protein
MGEMGADPMEAPGIKPQHPSSKHQRNLKHETSVKDFEVGAWDVGASPVLGAWMLVL